MLGDLVFNHPLGVLAQSLVNVLNAMQPAQGGGLPEILSARFGRLAAIQGRAGLIARGSLLQHLAFLRAIAPVWVDANLLPGLLLNDDDAVDLMSVVARSLVTRLGRVCLQQQPPFNRKRFARQLCAAVPTVADIATSSHNMTFARRPCSPKMPHKTMRSGPIGCFCLESDRWRDSILASR